MIIKFNEIDKEIYEYLKENKFAEFASLTSSLNYPIDSIRRSLEFLKVQGIISEKIDSKTVYEILDNGKIALKIGLIEEIFCNYLITKKINVSQVSTLEIPSLAKDEVNLAFGISKKKNLLTIINGEILISLDYKKKLEAEKNTLFSISQGNFENLDKDIIKELLSRKNFINPKTISNKTYLFNNIVNYELEDAKNLYLTSDILKSNNYKEIKFKEFDVTKLPSPKEHGRIHPLRQVQYYIRDIFLEMGFSEMSGPYVDIAFWPMDAMFISQNHPMRDIQDTFYLPYTGELPKDSKLIEEIKQLHLNGYDTGSSGHQYNWDENLAKQLILRTHTTSVTYRTFYSLPKKENAKYFCIGRAFRNETTDGSHLPEFNQVEGFVIGENLGLSDLMGLITEFANKIGIKKIKYKPTYNPYTEPSLECFAYFEKEKRWIEFINSGIFRPESVRPYGIKQTVIAWGLGLERAAMLLTNKSIKEILGDENDLDFLNNYKLPARNL
ncbi:MAG: phenylalanine--tRNA ligase subunit alpha [archaeon]